jgi:hypothetical protein
VSSSRKLYKVEEVKEVENARIKNVLTIKKLADVVELVDTLS